MPEKDPHSISVVLPVAEIREWERLAPGTAPKLAFELVRMARHQRMMCWAQFTVGALVRISACAIAIIMASRHATLFAAIPVAFAVAGDPSRLIEFKNKEDAKARLKL